MICGVKSSVNMIRDVMVMVFLMWFEDVFLLFWVLFSVVVIFMRNLKSLESDRVVSRVMELMRKVLLVRCVCCLCYLMRVSKRSGSRNRVSRLWCLSGIVVWVGKFFFVV